MCLAGSWMSPSVIGAAHPELPPPWLPGEHFAAALASFALGAVGLVVVAPDLAHGVFYLPRVVGVVHLFTLGWIVLSIFGALGQFLPVAVGRPLRWRALAHVSFGAQALGVTCFVTALVTGVRPLLLAGACAIALAFVAFAANLVATLATARERGLTFWALAVAAVFLVVTPAYGLVLAHGVHGAGLADRFTIVGQHAHLALAGVVLPVIVGVAHRLLPMFLLSHGAGERAAWLALALLAACAATLAWPHAGGARVAVAVVLGCGGVVAFLAQGAAFFHHRKRRVLDPGMRLAAAGMIGLALAAALAPLALARGLADLRLVTTYFVVLLGALTLFVAGHHYKIVPFIVWNHRYGPLVGTRKVPKVGELFSEKVANADAALLVTGVAGLALAAFVGSPGLARAAAAVLAAGALLQVAVIARVALRRVA